MRRSSCHVCGAPEPRRVPGLEGCGRVTSDCRPWPAVGALCVCGVCGCVQKEVDDTWRFDVERLYAGYAIYAQSGGADQVVFEQATGRALGRSLQLLKVLRRWVDLPVAGRLLDVGCGNGAFLQAVHQELPGWDLTGTELDDRHAKALRRIGARVVPTTAPWRVPGRFDLVSLIHVLEHVPAPVPWLAALRTRLDDRGHLLVQVPTFEENPFDLLVADHCSHFTAATARALLGHAGFHVEPAATDWVPKEVSLVTRPGSHTGGDGWAADGAFERVAERVDWLQRVLAGARSLAAGGRLGVLGTSIAGTWLGAQLEDRLAFFVDEDPQRTERPHLGRPVLAPDQVPAGSRVLVALPEGLARSVAGRLEAAGAPFRCHLPAQGEA